MNVEEEYLDVLQNIEMAIMAVYRDNPLLVDFDVENAIDALSSRYRSLQSGRESHPVRLNDRAIAVYEAVQTICELRLGRLPIEPGQPSPEPVSFEVIAACLKRIQKSVRKWNKEGGRQGYLTFVSRFLL